MKMIQMLATRTSLIVIAALAIIFQSCNDENETTEIGTEEQIEIVENSTEAEAISEEDIEIIDLAIEQTAGTGGRLMQDSICAVVTRDAEAKTITIDFGDGCVGPYGRERSGKIIITYGGTFDDGQANRTITFDNYYVNNKNITGAILLRDFNRNDAGNLTATRSKVDYTIHYPDGNALVINGSTVREWIEGEEDGTIQTNVFSITGSHEGVSTRGRTFTHTIIQPIIADFSCRASGGFVRVSGVKELVISNLDRSRTRTVDYGDGTCDNEITVTINDKTYTISRS